MMQAYSMDLRKRVLADCDAGLKTKQAADKYHVSPAWVRRLKQRRRETGDISARPRGGCRPQVVDRQRLAALVREQPDATLKELRDRLGVVCALSTLCTILKQLKFTYKKRHFGRLSKSVRMCKRNGPGGKRR